MLLGITGDAVCGFSFCCVLTALCIFFFKGIGKIKKKNNNCFLLAQVRIPLKNFKHMLRSEFWLRSGLLRTMYGTPERPETERPDRVQYFR